MMLGHDEPFVTLPVRYRQSTVCTVELTNQETVEKATMESINQDTMRSSMKSCIRNSLKSEPACSLGPPVEKTNSERHLELLGVHYENNLVYCWWRHLVFPK